MKPRHIFGIAVRVVGLIVALIGVYFLVCGLVLIIDSGYSDKLAPPSHYFIFGVLDSLIGYVLIRSAHRLVRLAYPDDSDD
jgi:hypothetical protein